MTRKLTAKEYLETLEAISVQLKTLERKRNDDATGDTTFLAARLIWLREAHRKLAAALQELTERANG